MRLLPGSLYEGFVKATTTYLKNPDEFLYLIHHPITTQSELCINNHF